MVHSLERQKVKKKCDNLAVVEILKTGKTRESFWPLVQDISGLLLLFCKRKV